MSKFGIDYLNLENRIYKKAYKLADVKEQLETVAFDIVKFRGDDNASNLWQIHSADDGDYIVALYQPDEDTKTASPWQVDILKTAGAVQISYKGDPLLKISASKLGVPQNELDKVKEYLPNKLAENKKLASALLNELSPVVKKSVLIKYPELV